MGIGLGGICYGGLGFLWIGMDLGLVLERIGLLGELRCGGFVGSFGLGKDLGTLLAFFLVWLTACGQVGLYLSQRMTTYLLPPVSLLTLPRPFLTSHYLCFVLSPPHVVCVHCQLLYFFRVWILTCLCHPLMLLCLAPVVFRTPEVFRIYPMEIGRYPFSAMVHSS